ncbi:hypothetical protein J437_LFUL018433 [Ladona fulva]|uniref:PiggyBac transposable element-derived protein domain-containing protein n=1 Tax=Ladona fulva TaxID=123851 RepID=A0A8K0KVQ7_LADFU|nr:hypothetical protein J437_LFUL018433 [Ladona fulva]
MPQKRARFGIKTSMPCESKSGYVRLTVIYTGKGTIRGKESEKISMSTQVVKSLMEPLLDKGYYLTTDNFFTLPELAELLISRSSDTYGTVGNKERNSIGSENEKKVKFAHLKIKLNGIVALILK